MRITNPTIRKVPQKTSNTGFSKNKDIASRFHSDQNHRKQVMNSGSREEQPARDSAPVSRDSLQEDAHNVLYNMPLDDAEAVAAEVQRIVKADEDMTGGSNPHSNN